MFAEDDYQFNFKFEDGQETKLVSDVPLQKGRLPDNAKISKIVLWHDPGAITFDLIGIQLLDA